MDSVGLLFSAIAFIISADMSMGIRTGGMQKSSVSKVVKVNDFTDTSLIDTNSTGKTQVTELPSTIVDNTAPAPIVNPEQDISSHGDANQPDKSPTVDTPNGTANEKQIDPMCIGEIVKPLSIEMEHYNIYKNGNDMTNQQHLISNTLDPMIKKSIFTIINFNLTDQAINYIKNLGDALDAKLHFKIQPNFTEFGYYCFDSNILLADVTDTNKDEILPENLTYHPSIYNAETKIMSFNISGIIKTIAARLTDIVNVAKTQQIDVEQVTNEEHAKTGLDTKAQNRHIIKFALFPGNKCIYDIEFDNNKPIIELHSSITQYKNNNSWRPCTEKCKSPNAYQCSPITCFEGPNGCEKEKMYEMRECVDADTCNFFGRYIPNVTNIMNFKSSVGIGFIIGGIVLIISFLLIRKGGANKAYAPIGSEDVAGSVFAGGSM